jgi:ubiquinone/menaquinone biosynthesis C-methylase UbiE
MALPFADSSFDAAVMALVLVFVPDPAKGVSEMVRVVVPGGAVVTYMWDMLGGSAQALRTCKREKLQCTELLQISTISG